MQVETIVRGDQTFGGVIDIGGALVCAGCKNPKAKAPSTMHADAKEWFLWTYRCECGNEITVKTMRRGEDKVLWAACNG